MSSASVTHLPFICHSMLPFPTVFVALLQTAVQADYFVQYDAASSCLNGQVLDGDSMNVSTVEVMKLAS